MNTPSVRAQVVTRRTYNRPLNKEGTVFETWSQTIDRVIGHQRWLWERALGGTLTRKQNAELEQLRLLMFERKALVAGRTLWLGGTEVVKRREASMFNCSGLLIRTVHDVVDAFWLLLQGCGVGFVPVSGTLCGFTRKMKVEVIRSTRTDKNGDKNNCESVVDGVWTIRIGDSAEAWAKAIGKLVAGKQPATKIVFDLSQIRPKGERLAGYGWICSGDENLSVALPAIAKIMNERAGKLLRQIDILDITNWLGTVLSSRRSAQIALMDSSSPEIDSFIAAKSGDWNNTHWHRGQSNNSVMFWENPGYKKILELLEAMHATGGGDPGIINAAEAKRRAPWFSVLNPCLTADTWVMTSEGARTILSLVGVPFKAIVNGEAYDSKGFFQTGVMPVLKVKLRNGNSVRMTGNHRVLVSDGDEKRWVEAKDLTTGMKVVLHNHRGLIWKSDGDCIESQSSQFVSLFLKAVFDVRGRIVEGKRYSVSVVINYEDEDAIASIHRSLARLGIQSTYRLAMNDKGETESYYELVISGNNLTHFLYRVGFSSEEKQSQLKELLLLNAGNIERESFTSEVESVTDDGIEPVYDCSVPGPEAFDANGMYVHNCAEILLADKGFCNLVTVDLNKFHGDHMGLIEAISLIARANYRQTVVNLKDGILQDAWHQQNEHLRLCGVSLTGHMTRPDLTEYDYRQFRNAAIMSAYSMADELGLERPKNVTTGKPEGTLSKIMDTLEGCHKPPGKYIFNNIGFNQNDPIVDVLRDANYKVFQHPKDPTSFIASLPVAFPTVDFGGGDYNKESAVSQLNRYKMIMDYYCEQNQSVTISYSQNELKPSAKWLEKNWNSIVGVCFLARLDPSVMLKYPYLPQEVVTEAKYREYVNGLKPVNIEAVTSQSDDSQLSIDTGNECAGGVCPIK